MYVPAVACVGDAISHQGAIVGGSPTVSDLGRGVPVARIGDPVACRIHGSQTIISGSVIVFADNIGIARVGDSISCGATIISGSPSVEAV